MSMWLNLHFFLQSTFGHQCKLSSRERNGILWGKVQSLTSFRVIIVTSGVLTSDIFSVDFILFALCPDITGF